MFWEVGRVDKGTPVLTETDAGSNPAPPSNWCARHYRELMLAAMLLEIFFVGTIAIFEALNFFKGR
jgi:hypothetical protein